MWPFRRSKNIFNGVPGPSPWYLRDGAVRASGFSWKDLGQDPTFAGKTALVGPSGPVAIIDFHHYVSLLDSHHLVIWHQRHVESGPTAPVRIVVLDLRELNALNDDLETVCSAMTESKTALLFDGPTLAEIDLETLTTNSTMSVTFPEPLNRVDELLILCHSSGVTPEPSWQQGNLALLVAHPREGTYKLYSQDWFNNANFDFGYQWVTRVVRDPDTQQIHGEGIRIAPFTLDATLRATVPYAAR